MESNKEHRSTSRVLDVLEIISSNCQGYTLTEICNAVKAPKSSMFPIIHTLHERKFILYNEKDKKYYIGPISFQVGNSFFSNFDLLNQVKNEMQCIVDKCMETCHFGVLVSGDVMYLNKIDSPEPVRMVSTIGKKLPAYSTGLGKALLIDLDIADLRKLYPDGLKQLTPNTVTDFDKLSAQLHQARMEGITYEIEESNQYIRCIAVPIRKRKKVVAALSIAYPTFRYSEGKNELGKQLLLNSKRKIEIWLENTSIDFFSMI